MEWVDEKKIDRASYLLPAEVGLEIGSFKAFIEARRVLLAKRLREVAGEGLRVTFKWSRTLAKRDERADLEVFKSRQVLEAAVTRAASKSAPCRSYGRQGAVACG